MIQPARYRQEVGRPAPCRRGMSAGSTSLPSSGRLGSRAVRHVRTSVKGHRELPGDGHEFPMTVVRRLQRAISQ
jgi:hypothetical protein